MPNIPTYSSRVPTPQPDERSISAHLATGRAFADLAGTISNVSMGIFEQRQEARALEESANLAADLATTQAELDLKLEDAKKTADPNAPEFQDFSADFLAKIANPRIDQLGAGLTTKRAQAQLRETQAKLRGKYQIQSSLAQSELSSAQAAKNIRTLGNVQIASVRADPATLDISIGIVDHAIEGLIAAGMDRGPALELQRTLNSGIAQSAAMGLAAQNPTAARKALDAGKYSAYLSAEQQREVINEIEMQEKAVEQAKRTAEADAKEQKRIAAEASESEWTSQILLNPTKVDPRAIANDPRLDGTQKRVLSNFLDDHLKPEGGDPDANKGPGFWAGYQRVFANGYKSTDEIYAQAGPGKPLTLQGANALATLWRGRQERTKAGNYEDERIKRFFDQMEMRIARPNGFTVRPTQEGLDAWTRFYYTKSKQLEDRGDKSIDQLLDENSSDYLGKDWESYKPKRPVRTGDSGFVPLKPKETQKSLLESLWGMFGGSPNFKLEELDKVQSADEGRTRLRAALASGAITKEAAGEYLVKRGWAAPNPVKPSVAPAMK